MWEYRRLSTGMQFVASLVDPQYIPVAQESGADLIELRLDRFTEGMTPEACRLLEENALPVILTVRSAREGGVFAGPPGDWPDIASPFLPYADYVDLEQAFAGFAPDVRRSGKKVIASYHHDGMLPMSRVKEIEAVLREFGDPKIVLRPDTLEDILSICRFTADAEKPITTSIMGARFRFARIMLPLFGSSMIFCHVGIPAAEGQFTIEEARRILIPLLSVDYS